MINNFLQEELGSRVFSWLVLLLPALALTTSRGAGAIEIIFILATIIYARPLWQHRNALFGESRWIVIAFALNLATIVTSLAWSGSPFFSGLDYPLRQFLVVGAIGLIVLHKPEAKWFWYGLFIGTIGAAGLAVYQRFALHWDRAGGFHQIIMFGDIAMAMGLMSLASIGHFSRTRLALLPYLAFLAGLTASILSVTKGGWIALLFSFIPLYSYGQDEARRRMIVVAFAGMALLIGACFVPQLGVGSRLANISTDIHQYLIGNPGESIGARLELWEAAWKMFLAHPFVGIGQGNFQQALATLIEHGEIHASVGYLNHAHNEMFNALATRGLFGGISLTFMYAAPFVFFMRTLRRKDDSQPYALAGLLLVLSYIDFGLSQVLFAHHIGTTFYALTIAVLAGLCVMTPRVKQ